MGQLPAPGTAIASFALRLPDHLLELARAASAKDQVSINQMFVAFIAEGLGHRRGLKAPQERASHADIPAALAALDQVPDVTPEAGTELPEARNARKARG